MSVSTTSTSPPSPPKPTGILGWIEWAGNKLPDPAMLFVWALLITWVLSAILSNVQFADIDPRTGTKDVEAAAPVLVPNAKSGTPVSLRREHLALLGQSPLAAFPATIPWQPTQLGYRKEAKKTLQVQNQLTPTALTRFLTGMVKTFTDFPPLGLVLVALLGVGVAEHTGFVNAVLKAMLSFTPRALLTPMLVTVGIMSHSAGDAGYVLVIPLGGVIFAAAGRHPVAGIVAAFAAVSGGFSANFLISGLDPLLQGFTQSAAQIINPARTVNPLCNYNFMALSSILIIGVAWLITDRLIEPRLLRTMPVDPDITDMPTMDPLQPVELRAMLAGLGSLVAFFVLLAAAAYPSNSTLRARDGGLFEHDSPLIIAIVPLIFLMFLIPGVVYGYMAGTVKSHRDVVKGMSKSMSTMGYYLVLAFFAALFTYAFRESNLGVLVALKGAGFLQSLQLPPAFTILGIILITTLVNLLIGSASAKWALLGPIFVPMLMTIGLSPELTQAAFRIGDSSTNIITPLMPYFPLVVVYAQRYVKSTGVGTLIAQMLPYSISFLLTWTSFLMFYWLVLGWPLGVNAPYTYP